MEFFVFWRRGRRRRGQAREHGLHDRRPSTRECLHVERGRVNRRRGRPQRRQLLLLRPRWRRIVPRLLPPPRLWGPRLIRIPQRDIRLRRTCSQVPGEHSHRHRIYNEELRTARSRHRRRERRVIDVIVLSCELLIKHDAVLKWFLLNS